MSVTLSAAKPVFQALRNFPCGSNTQMRFRNGSAITKLPSSSTSKPEGPSGSSSTAPLETNRVGEFTSLESPCSDVPNVLIGIRTVCDNRTTQVTERGEPVDRGGIEPGTTVDKIMMIDKASCNIAASEFSQPQLNSDRAGEIESFFWSRGRLFTRANCETLSWVQSPSFRET